MIVIGGMICVMLLVAYGLYNSAKTKSVKESGELLDQKITLLSEKCSNKVVNMLQKLEGAHLDILMPIEQALETLLRSSEELEKRLKRVEERTTALEDSSNESSNTLIIREEVTDV